MKEATPIMILNGGAVPIFAVYENPSDYPGKYVVRMWVGPIACAAPVAICDNLQTARNKINDVTEGRYVNIGRIDAEDPVIKEIWCHGANAEELKGERLKWQTQHQKS
jgi:hypothetical protein